MYKSAISSIGSSLVVVLFLYSSLTIEEEYNYKNNLLNYVEIFAQEENNIPVVKNLQIIEFNGINYTDIVNSQDINPNSFTVSVWFNTAMNVTAEIDNAILLKIGEDSGL